MALPHIVDQDRHVEIVHHFFQSRVIGIVVGCEIHGEDLGGIGPRRLGLDAFGEGLEFGFGAGDKEDVEAALGELDSEFLADAVGGAGYDGPAGAGTEGAELVGLWLAGDRKTRMEMGRGMEMVGILRVCRGV